MSNININRINITISPADMAALTAAFSQANAALAAYTQALTEDERNSLHSVAVENAVFSDNALKQGKLLVSQFPPDAQPMVTSLETDTAFYKQLETIMNTLVLPFLMKVKDTSRLVAHERHAISLSVYKIVKNGASLGLPGFQAAYDILKQRFAKQTGRTQSNDVI